MTGAAITRSLIASAMLASAIHAEPAAGDWRLELLATEGVPTDTEGLRKFQSTWQTSPARFNEVVKLLGAEKFSEREKAEGEILMMGKDVLPWLRARPKQDDPEIRLRLEGIAKNLTSKGRWEKQDLLRQAVDSLLRERVNKEAPAVTFLAEFFQTDAPSLRGKYRKFEYKAEKGMTASVSNGALRIAGMHGGDGDQTLFLAARDWTGRDTYPGKLRVETRIGGKKGGEGAYHVGVSIGNVKALFHPGYSGGGFRFETLDEHAPLTENKSMGFDPSTSDLQRMSIEATPDATGGITLEVVVSNGTKSFREKKIFTKETIGKLDRIGLQRSGRSGGDAVFDDLVVDLENR